jgi:hypothetical protein
MSASYLYYDGATFNGTASYALAGPTIGSVQHAVYADSASYVNNIVPFSSASWASLAENATTAYSADYLNYSSNVSNGTASYAIFAGSVAGNMNVYGMFSALTQSTAGADIDVLDVQASNGQSCNTMIDVWGNLILDYTASISLQPSISLVIINRQNGNQTVLDTSTISFNTTPALSTWGSLETGSFHNQFMMAGQPSLYGYYYVYVSSSTPSLRFDTSRPINFSISSFSNNASVYAAEPATNFYVMPNGLVTASFYTTASGGPYSDYIAGMEHTGSGVITTMSIANQGVTDVRYTYYLITMSYFNCSQNLGLTSLNYAFPPTLNKFLCSTCSLSFIYDLSNTDIQYLDCSNNQLSYLPTFYYEGLTYLKCSNNPLIEIPSFPITLITLYCDTTNITQTSFLPNSLLTASFSSSYITTISLPFPPSMSYINMMGNPITTIPNMPLSCSYVNFAFCSLTIQSIRTLTSNLVTNAQYNGTLDLRGYGPLVDGVTTSNIGILTSRGWSVLQD